LKGARSSPLILIYDNSSIRAKMGRLERLGGARHAFERRIFSA